MEIQYSFLYNLGITCFPCMSLQMSTSWTVSDAVNYKGLPADKSKTGGWMPAALVLG